MGTEVPISPIYFINVMINCFIILHLFDFFVPFTNQQFPADDELYIAADTKDLFIDSCSRFSFDLAAL
jgi:hypothetical protein